MEPCTFEPLSLAHQDEVMAIFNHYIEHSTAAYRQSPVGRDHFLGFIEHADRYPAYALLDGDRRVAGFCWLEPYASYPTFAGVAEISYFLAPGHTGKGLGTAALRRLETDARAMGLRKLVANISSANEPCLAFHRRHGFREYGRLEDIGRKLGTTFSIVWMGKDLEGAPMEHNPDLAQIDAVIGAFFSAFDNRAGRLPTLEAITGLLVPGAVIVKAAGPAFELMTPASFAEPRVALLTRGELTEFHEWETSSETEIRGALATRRSRYAKAGTWAGKPYAGEGTKHTQLIKTGGRWLILSVAWEDDPA
jgi:phosphinothricin acetyltransferase